MYLNVITFKNSKTCAFTTELPYSTDKVSEGWNIIAITDKKQTVSFRGSEVVSIVNQEITGEIKKKAPKIGGMKPPKNSKMKIAIE